MSHIREHHSLLAGVERRLLVAMAQRFPPFINSDHLSVVALLAMLAGGAAFAAISRSVWFALLFVACLVLNWFGDSLDGTLARVRNRQRPNYGYYVDHVIDLAGTTALLAGMALSGVMTPAVGFALLAAYLLVASESFLGAHALGVFRLSFAGIGPTELRILLAAGAVKVAIDPVIDFAGRRLWLLDVGGAIAIVGLAVTFVAAAVRNSLALYRAEPLPRTGAGHAPEGIALCLPQR